MPRYRFLFTETILKECFIEADTEYEAEEIFNKGDYKDTELDSYGIELIKVREVE